MCVQIMALYPCILEAGLLPESSHSEKISITLLQGSGKSQATKDSLSLWVEPHCRRTINSGALVSEALEKRGYGITT